MGNNRKCAQKLKQGVSKVQMFQSWVIFSCITSAQSHTVSTLYTILRQVSPLCVALYLPHRFESGIDLHTLLPSKKQLRFPPPKTLKCSFQLERHCILAILKQQLGHSVMDHSEVQINALSGR